jgi:tetratricopeptide (TPR) repeat protein
MLGTSYDELKRSADAISAHQQAVQLDPTFHEAWNNLGIAHFNAGHIERAVECVEKALELKPEYAFAFGSLGGIEIHRNEPERAIEYLQKAIRLYPGMAVAHSNLALAYGMMGRFEQAEVALKHAVALGYRNWKEIRARLENLRECDSNRDAESPMKRPIGFTSEEE